MKIQVVVILISLTYVFINHTTAESAPHSKQNARSTTSHAVEFRVVQVVRPKTRLGKNLNQTPREIYLYASRPPLDEEKNATHPHAWKGQVLNVYRLQTIEANVAYPSAEQLKWMARLKEVQQQKKLDRQQALEEAKKDGSPIEIEQPKMPSPALENQDDDDEIEMQSMEEDQICGHENESCCIQAKRGPCELGLICKDQICQVPPPPCGSLEQRCCEEEPSCLTGLMCRTDEARQITQMQCLLPPQVPSRKKILIGQLRIVDVQKRLIRAEVLQDALKKQNSSSIFAISIRDLAELH